MTTRLAQSTAWAEAMIQARGVEGVRVLIGLLNLTGRHLASAIDHACEIAHGYGEYRLRTIRASLRVVTIIDSTLIKIIDSPSSKRRAA